MQRLAVTPVFRTVAVVGFPVHTVLRELRAQLASREAVVLSAPPGSGKTVGCRIQFEAKVLAAQRWR